jgi:glycosyltransferase involved in cell wall biosynthesis
MASFWAFKAALLQVPSLKLNPFERRDRQVRLLATTMVRDEREFLPGMLRSVGPQVDGIVALDDGSSDGTDQLLEQSPYVLEVMRNPSRRPSWDEPAGQRRLVAAALRHQADWIISVDADERLELDFRSRAERVIRRGRLVGLSAFVVYFRELWDSPDQYRVDGIWGKKRAARLFRALADHQFDDRPLHGAKAPIQGKVFGVFPFADLVIYHLRMMRREDREARRNRYEQLDPEARWQPGIGYAYLTNARGIRLHRIPAARGYQK